MHNQLKPRHDCFAEHHIADMQIEFLLDFQIHLPLNEQELGRDEPCHHVIQTHAAIARRLWQLIRRREPEPHNLWTSMRSSECIYSQISVQFGIRTITDAYSPRFALSRRVQTLTTVHTIATRMREFGSKSSSE